MPDGEGRLRSEQLGVSLGLWHGSWDGREDDWLRLFRPDGSLVPTRDEAAEQQADAERRRANAAQQQAEVAQQRADAEQQRADAEGRRAELAEAELARLRALLEERNAG